MIGTSAGCAGQQEAEQDRPDQPELGADEAGDLAELEAQPAESGIVRGVAQRGEAMRQVPGDVRRQAQRRGGQGEAVVGERDPPPGGRVEDQIEQGAGQEVEHGVLGEQPAADGQAAAQRPSPAAAVAPADQAIERQRPEQQQRHVGGDQRGRQPDARQRRIGDRRPGGESGPAELPGDAPDHQRGRPVQQRARQPHRPLAIAEQAGGGGDKPGDQRRLRVVAPGELLGPVPVLRFLEVELERRRRDEQHAGSGQRCDDGEYDAKCGQAALPRRRRQGRRGRRRQGGH